MWPAHLNLNAVFETWLKMFAQMAQTITVLIIITNGELNANFNICQEICLASCVNHLTES